MIKSLSISFLGNVVCLTEEHPEIVDEGIEANETYKHHILNPKQAGHFEI